MNIQFCMCSENIKDTEKLWRMTGRLGEILLVYTLTFFFFCIVWHFQIVIPYFYYKNCSEKLRFVCMT